MATAPSPSPKLGVEGKNILSIIIILLLVIVSIFVRRSGNRFLHYFHTFLLTLYIEVITYVIAAVDSDTPSPILIVSAALLQVVCNKTNSYKAMLVVHKRNNNDDDDDDDDDNDKDIRLSDISPIVNLTIIGWLIFLLFNDYYYNLKDYQSFRKGLNVPVCILLVLSFVEVVHNKLAFAAATRSFRVGKNVKVVAAYMKELQQNGDGQVDCFESGCKYLVGGEEKQTMELSPNGYTFKTTSKEDLITVDKVWTCEGKLLKENERNKDVCLSFSLSKLLRLSSEEQRALAKANSRSLDLVLHGPFKEPARAFRIVERELTFIDVSLHSPLPNTYFSWFAISNILLSLLFLAFSLYIGCCVLRGVIQGDSDLHKIYLPSNNTCSLSKAQCALLMYIDAVVCLLILIVAVSMEIGEVGSYIISDHARVVLLCKYVKNQRRRPFVGKVIEFFYPNLRILRKLWSEKLGQYSLFRNKKESPIKLSSEVKEAVIVSLRNIIGKETSTNSSSC